MKLDNTDRLPRSVGLSDRNERLAQVLDEKQKYLIPERQRITFTLDGIKIPMVVDGHKEELYRRAQTRLDQKLNEYRNEYRHEATMPHGIYVTMVAIDTAYRLEELMEERDDSDFNDKILFLNREIDSFLEEHAQDKSRQRYNK